MAPGPVWTGAENLAPTGIRSPDRQARNESLYRLSYPAQPTAQSGTTKDAISICITQNANNCIIVIQSLKYSASHKIRRAFTGIAYLKRFLVVIARVTRLRTYEWVDRKVKWPTRKAIKIWLQKVHLLQSVQYPSNTPTENFEKSHLQR